MPACGPESGAEPGAAATSWSTDALAARDAIVSVARRIVRDRAEAEDVADEAIARLVDVARKGGSIDSVAGWLHRAALRIAVDRARAWVRRRRPSWRHDAARRVTPLDPASALEDVETRERLWRAILELPDRQRETVVLRQMEGRSYDEIAALLGISEATVRGHAHAARGALRRKLWDLGPEGER